MENCKPGFKETNNLISCDEAINEIAEVLCGMSGESINEIYTKIVKRSKYLGDNLIKNI
jgi:hypothetical protein